MKLSPVSRHGKSNTPPLFLLVSSLAQRRRIGSYGKLFPNSARSLTSSRGSLESHFLPPLLPGAKLRPLISTRTFLIGKSSDVQRETITPVVIVVVVVVDKDPERFLSRRRSLPLLFFLIKIFPSDILTVI